MQFEESLIDAINYLPAVDIWHTCYPILSAGNIIGAYRRHPYIATVVRRFTGNLGDYLHLNLAT